MGSQVAIKVLLPELSANKTIVERFFNEARAAGLPPARKLAAQQLDRIAGRV